MAPWAGSGPSPACSQFDKQPAIKVFFEGISGSLIIAGIRPNHTEFQHVTISKYELKIIMIRCIITIVLLDFLTGFISEVKGQDTGLGRFDFENPSLAGWEGGGGLASVSAEKPASEKGVCY